MKLFSFSKDGGPESTVFGYFLVEIKKLFSVVLLNFKDGSREAYHEHAFDAISWVLKGKLIEHHVENELNMDVEVKWTTQYRPSIIPIITKRSTFHKVVSEGDTWVLSLRGPWSDTWREFLPKENRLIMLTHGRKEVQ